MDKSKRRSPLSPGGHVCCNTGHLCQPNWRKPEIAGGVRYYCMQPKSIMGAGSLDKILAGKGWYPQRTPLHCFLWTKKNGPSPKKIGKKEERWGSRVPVCNFRALLLSQIRYGAPQRDGIVLGALVLWATTNISRRSEQDGCYRCYMCKEKRHFSPVLSAW